MMGRKAKDQDKTLDVDASMQGSLIFKDPVNLRINGRFEGTLNTKGNLMVGEHAVVDADIVGESIIIAGKVTGNIHAAKDLKLIAPAVVMGEIKTPLLSIAEGAVFEGSSKMLYQAKGDTVSYGSMLSQKELAKYLEVDETVILDWVNSGRLAGIRDGGAWRFDRLKIDEWVASEKIK